LELWIVIGLMVIGLLAMFVEIFVPAGGLIGIAGLGCYIAGIVLTFRNFNTVVGYVMLAVSLVSAPVFFALAFKIFPKTFMGKRLILRQSQQSDSGYTSFSSEKYANLQGQEGVALTKLRPSGMVEIGGKKYSVVTAGEFIDTGDRIKVSTTEGSRIVVRKSG
jgi:membrane-bound serine protease (ClpP class)